MKKMNKKGNEYGMAFLAVIVVIIVFLTASYSLYGKVNGVGKTLGDTQYKLLNTYDNAEKINFYIDEAAKKSADDALYKMSKNGGIASIECSSYFGSTLLVSQEDDCLPKDESDVSEEFLNTFKRSFYTYLSNYPYANVNSEYDLNYYEGLLVGISSGQINLPITSKIIEELRKSNETIKQEEKIENLQGGQKIVEIAKTQIGKHYPPKEKNYVGGKPLATNENPTYFDCAGLTGWSIKKAGVESFPVPTSAKEQYTYMKNKNTIFYDSTSSDPKLNNIENYKKALTTPGILLFSFPPQGAWYTGHVGLTIGDGTNIIEAGGNSRSTLGYSGVAISKGFWNSGKPKFEVAGNIPGFDYSVQKTNDQTQQQNNTNQNNLARKIAVIGDSITADKVYVNELKNLINNNSFGFDVYAVAGKDTKWMYQQFIDNIKGKGYTDLIILGGINNIDPITGPKNDLTKIYSEAKTDNIRVIALTLTPYEKYPNQIKQLNDWIKSKPQGVSITVDIYTPLNENDKLAQKYITPKDSPINLHPNNEGKKIIAKTIYDSAFSNNQQTTNSISQTQSTTTCEGITVDQLRQGLSNNVKYSKCAQYVDLIKKYADKNKLEYNIVLLASVIYGESNCVDGVDKGNGYGLMQVTGVWKDKFPNYKGNAEAQIEAGMGILKYYSDSTKNLNINELTKMKLALYGYNRGNNDNVVSLMKNNNMNLKDAMITACQKVYTDPGCGTHRKYMCVNGVPTTTSMCTGPGLGSNYADKILKEYENICKAAGGVVGSGSIIQQQNSIDPSATTYDSIGAYSFTPAFEMEIGYNFSVYKKIYDTLLKLNYKYNDLGDDEKDAFMNSIVLEAKTIEPSVDWSLNCDEPIEKMYYSFAENYYLCANSVDTNCYCEMNLSKQVSLDNFNFVISPNPPEGNDGTQFLLSGSTNEEIINEAKIGFKSDNTSKGVPNDDIKINGRIDNSNLKLSVEIPTSNGNENYEYNQYILEPFFMYKENINNDMSRISFIATKKFFRNGFSTAYYDKVRDDYNKKTLKTCKIQKDTVKFCVDSKKKILVYDNIKKNISFVNNNIKFAYTFRDILPPLAVYDILKNNDVYMTDKSAIITWTHENKFNDNLIFKVYYSKYDFSDRSIKSIKNDADIKVITLEKSNNIISRGVNILNPEVKFESYKLKPSYPDLSFDIEENKVYEFEKTSQDQIVKYASKIVFDADDEYYFMVSVSDRKNNELGVDEKKTNYDTIKVKDNLAPATYPLVGFMFSQPEIKEDKIKVAWGYPYKNVDGSNFDFNNELKEFRIYYSEELNNDNFFSSSVITIDKNKFDNEDSLISYDKSKGMCIYVVPVDMNNNIQFSDSTKELMKNTNFFSPKCVLPIK